MTRPHRATDSELSGCGEVARQDLDRVCLSGAVGLQTRGSRNAVQLAEKPKDVNQRCMLFQTGAYEYGLKPPNSAYRPGGTDPSGPHRTQDAHDCCSD